MKAKNITKEHFINVCENSISMAKAAAALDLHFTTFKKYAIQYGCYKTNQPGKVVFIPDLSEQLINKTVRMNILNTFILI